MKDAGHHSVIKKAIGQCKYNNEFIINTLIKASDFADTWKPYQALNYYLYNNYYTISSAGNTVQLKRCELGGKKRLKI